MSTDLVTLEADEDMGLADTIMALGKIRHLPVVDQGFLVGLVSNRDILRAKVSKFADVTDDEESAMERTIKAREIMTRPVRTVSPEFDALGAAQMMFKEKYGCLPVVDDGRLVGILTESDFVRLVINGLQDFGNVANQAEV